MLDSARLLKREVLGLLESYASRIATNDLRSVRKQIPDDSKRIAVKLQDI